MPSSSRKQVNGLKGKQAPPDVMTGLEKTMTATLGGRATWDVPVAALQTGGGSSLVFCPNERIYAHLFLSRMEAYLWRKQFLSPAVPVALVV